MKFNVSILIASGLLMPSTAVVASSDAGDYPHDAANRKLAVSYSYSHIGTGKCQNGNGAYLSNMGITPIGGANGCFNICQENPGLSPGFMYWDLADICYCLLNGGLPTPLPTYSVSGACPEDNGNASGPITGADGFQGFECYAIEATVTSPAPTSLAPVTTSPTSMAPVSLSPTSHSPSSVQPTSHSPTSTSPTSHIPTTTRPSSLSPTSSRPTSLAPVTPLHTGKPTTHSPSTLHPTTHSPVTTHPSSHSPSTGSPTSHSPSTGSPTSLAPVTASPVSHAPVTTSPTSHAPVTPSPIVATKSAKDSKNVKSSKSVKSAKNF